MEIKQTHELLVQTHGAKQLGTIKLLPRFHKTEMKCLIQMDVMPDDVEHTEAYLATLRARKFKANANNANTSDSCEDDFINEEDEDKEQGMLSVSDNN